MKKIIHKLNDFLFLENDSYNWITFFRVAVGFLLALHFISILPDFDKLYSTKGIIPSDILDVFIPSNVITLPKIIHYLDNFGIVEERTIVVFKVLYIAFSIFIAVGFIPRTSALFLLFLQISLTKGSYFYTYGVDFFSSMSLFYLIMIPSHYEFSVYTLFKCKIKTISITAYRRLFQIHLCLAYFFSGFDKILGFNWWNGESIWKAINLPFANKDFNFNFGFLAHFPASLVLIGWATIIIEMFYPLFIWMPQTRKLWLYLTISMHIGIALTLNLYFFASIMIIWNFTNFYSFDK